MSGYGEKNHSPTQESIILIKWYNIQMEPIITKSHETDNDSISLEAEVYEREFLKKTKGPQLEGLTAEEATLAMEDSRTICASTEVDGVTYSVPVLVPLHFAGWYNPAFTEKIEPGATKYFYAALPGQGFSDEALAEIREKLAGQEIVIFFDEIEDSGRTNEIHLFLEKLGASQQAVNIGQDGNGATLTHFGGVACLTNREGVSGVNEQGIEQFMEVAKSRASIEQGKETRVLCQPVSDLEFEQIWAFYNESFKKVNADHPILQSFDREGLRKKLDSEKTVSVVHSEDGVIVGLAMLSQLDDCEWLNKEFYRTGFSDFVENGNITHMPSIVVDEAYRGRDFTTELISELVDINREAKTDMAFVTECNDKTVQYIPHLVESFFDGKTVDMTLDLEQITVYRYKAIKATF